MRRNENGDILNIDDCHRSVSGNRRTNIVELRRRDLRRGSRHALRRQGGAADQYFGGEVYTCDGDEPEKGVASQSGDAVCDHAYWHGGE